MKRVTLISKDDCHLCDVAKEVILNVRKKVDFEMNETKIVQGEKDFETYSERIPVILIDGNFAFQYKVSERQLLEKLQQR